MPARDAQVVLGHSTVTATLDIYSAVFDTEIALGINKVNDALAGPEPGDVDSGDEL